MSEKPSIVPVVIAACLAIVSGLLSWEIMGLQERNKAQDAKIQELSERVATWEQLVGPRMQNLTNLIEQVDDNMATIIRNHNDELANSNVSKGITETYQFNCWKLWTHEETGAQQWTPCDQD